MPFAADYAESADASRSRRAARGWDVVKNHERKQLRVQVLFAFAALHNIRCAGLRPARDRRNTALVQIAAAVLLFRVFRVIRGPYSA